MFTRRKGEDGGL